MTSSLVRFVAVSATVLLGVGCGSNAPEIPEDIKGGAQGSSGTEPGQIPKDSCFEGWPNPAAVGFAGSLQTVCIYDFHDPIGTRGGIELLLLNTSALWCQACRQEHQTLGEEVAKFGPRGFRLVSLLFQDNERNPAKVDHLTLWTRQYEVAFPMVLDPNYLMGAYAPGDTAPLNLLLDARDSMRILKKWTGNQESVIWPAIESELAARGR